MRFLLIIALCFPLLAPAATKKEKKRTPTSVAEQFCYNVKSLETRSGRFIINDELAFLYTTGSGQNLAYQTLVAALISNTSNDLCVLTSQENIGAKLVRADWPALIIRPRR